VLRLDSGLFFATAEALEERIRELVEADGDTSVVVLDLGGVNFIDSQGAEKLTEIQRMMENGDGTLRLARVKPQVYAVLRADGFVDRLGSQHIHGNVDRAVEAQLNG
jgi:anti-anti-sigma factor